MPRSTPAPHHRTPDRPRPRPRDGSDDGALAVVLLACVLACGLCVASRILARQAFTLEPTLALLLGLVCLFALIEQRWTRSRSASKPDRTSTVEPAPPDD